ncbi:MAG: hypothetical protein ACRD5M_16455 [Candidatus Acidiferrales bacterium]
MTGKPSLQTKEIDATVTLSPIAISLPTVEIGVAPEFLTLLALLLSGAPGLLGQLIQQVEGLRQDWIDKLKNLGDSIVGAVSGVFEGIKLSAPVGPGRGPIHLGGAPTPVQPLPPDVAAAAALLLPLISIKLGTVKIAALQEKGVVGPTIGLKLPPIDATVDLGIAAHASIDAITTALAGCVSLDGTLNGTLP